MRDVLNTVHTYLSRGEEVIFARVASMSGFGGRRAGESMHIGANSVSGELAMGAATEKAVVAAREMLQSGEPTRVITVPVSDEDAVNAGLACGGSAEVILQQASTLPSELFALVANGTDVILVTHLHSGHSTAITATTSGTSATATNDQVNPEMSDAIGQAQRMFSKGPKSIVIGEIIGEHDHRILLHPILSTPQLLVLGLAELSNAIAHQATLLGWNATIAAESGSVAMANQASQLGPNDGVVVLSHDLAASTAVLAAALRGNCGYVGALGSRHTQQARADLLRSTHELDQETVDRVHGPVGLDIGSRTPEETALAIAAEMLAVTRRRAATPLVQQAGPING